MAAVSAPLVVVVGDTASGKTALGIELAKKFNGEIICADSRTIYRGMDIGTAKPTNEEQAGVPHHLLDIRDPDEAYTVVDFQKDAQQLITDIASRGKLPIMVGGSGLYVDAVVYDYSFMPDGTRDAVNPRHLASGTGVQDKELRDNTLIIGLRRDPEELGTRIARRTNNMIETGLVAEVQGLITKYGRDNPVLGGSYKIIADHLEGALMLDEAVQQIVRSDTVLAKKQRTWFKRNKSIQWLHNREDAVAITTTFLNNLPK